MCFVLGFPLELSDRGSGRFLGGFDVDLWTCEAARRRGCCLSAGAAVLLSLAIRAYGKLYEGRAAPLDG